MRNIALKHISYISASKSLTYYCYKVKSIYSTPFPAVLLRKASDKRYHLLLDSSKHLDMKLLTIRNPTLFPFLGPALLFNSLLTQLYVFHVKRPRCVFTESEKRYKGIYRDPPYINPITNLYISSIIFTHCNQV